jgi:hypothetical protein
MPKGFIWVRDVVKKVVDHYSAQGYTLARPFKHSVYPAVTFNFPPYPETAEHTDPGNAPCISCSVTPEGPYDADRSAHFVLFDLFLIVRFPPGSTIQLCSAGLCHGNTPIHPDDRRACIIQYCAGGLKRHIDYGFRTEEELFKTDRALLREIMGDAKERAREAMSLYSTASSLDDDRKLLS